MKLRRKCVEFKKRDNENIWKVILYYRWYFMYEEWKKITRYEHTIPRWYTPDIPVYALFWNYKMYWLHLRLEYVTLKVAHHLSLPAHDCQAIRYDSDGKKELCWYISYETDSEYETLEWNIAYG